MNELLSKCQLQRTGRLFRLVGLSSSYVRECFLFILPEGVVCSRFEIVVDGGLQCNGLFRHKFPQSKIPTTLRASVLLHELTFFIGHTGGVALFCEASKSSK